MRHLLRCAVVDPRVRRPDAFNVIDEEGPVGFEPDRLAKHKAELVRLALRECNQFLQNEEHGEAQHRRSSKYMLRPLEGASYGRMAQWGVGLQECTNCFELGSCSLEEIFSALPKS